MSITIESMESHSDKEMGAPEGVHLTITDNEGNRPVTLVVGHGGDFVFISPGGTEYYPHNENVGDTTFMDESHTAIMMEVQS
jgi:hypothetical protein